MREVVSKGGLGGHYYQQSRGKQQVKVCFPSPGLLVFSL